MEFAPVLILSFLMFLLGCLESRSRFQPVVVLFTIVSLLYVGGILHVLLITKILLWCAIFGMFAWIWVRKRQALRFSPEVFLIFLFQLFLFYKLRDVRFTHWDEFTNWGPLTSSLVRTNALTPASLLGPITTYPLGHSLWEYFLILSEYRESILNCAVAVWLVTCLALAIPRFQLPSKQRWLWGFLAIFILYASNYVLGREWQSIYADHVMGVTFGVGLIAAFHFQLVPLALILFVLPQLKMLGLIFALVVLGFAALMRWMDRHAFKNWAPKILGLFGLIVVSALSWKFYCAQTHLSSPFILNKARIMAETPAQVLLLKNIFIMFLKNLFLRPLDNFWPLPVWVLCFGVWFRLLAPSLGRRKLRAAGWFLGINFYLYLLVLLSLYIAFFSDFEAEKLASWERYEDPFLYGTFLFLLSLTLENLPALSWAKKWLAWISFMLILGSPMRAWQFPLTDLSVRDDLIIRMQGDVEKLQSFAKEHPHAKIWAIRTPSQHLEAQYLFYQFPELDWHNRNSFVRRHPDEYSAWGYVIGDKFSQELEQVEYVWLSAVDEVFWRDFGDAFDCSSMSIEDCHRYQLFRVNKGSGQNPSLQPY